MALREFGGIALAVSGGFGWMEVDTARDPARTYGELVAALLAKAPVEGFCYTQLNDSEQERNGLLTFDRRPKIDPSILRPLTQTPKQR